MPNVITEASLIQCPHLGTVKATASQSVLAVDGNKVLVQSDLLSATVTCPAVPAPGVKPCTKVASVTAGAAAKLTAGGQPVLLETAQGLTDGTPPQWRVVSAGQTKLRAS
jgi:hypothetical protein